jgi:hypothetical protein
MFPDGVVVPVSAAADSMIYLHCYLLLVTRYITARKSRTQGMRGLQQHICSPLTRLITC